MRRAMLVMAGGAFVAGLVGGTMWGQMGDLREAGGPRRLPPEMVVATGHPLSVMMVEMAAAETGPGTRAATAPRGRAAAVPAAVQVGPGRVVIPGGVMRGPMVIQGPVVIQGGAGGLVIQGGRVAAGQPLATMKMGDVATFFSRGGRLWVDVHFPGPGAASYAQVKMEGFEGTTLVQSTASNGISNYGLIIRQVLPTGAVGTYVVLTRKELRIRMPLGGEGVELVEQMKGDLGEAADDAGGVALNVWAGGQYSGPATVALKGDDLRGLRVAEPGAFRKYVRPLLTKLGAERACLPDGPEATQILAPRLSVDEATERKFTALLPRLDADAREEREAASKSLGELGWRGALAAEKVDLAKVTVEQRVRLKDFLADYTYLDEKEAERCRGDVDVLVDCLALEDADLVKAAAAQLEEVTKKKIAVDAELPAEKRLGMLEEWRAEAKGK